MDGSSDKGAGSRAERIVVTCAKGLGPWLQRELRGLGAFVEAVEAAHVVTRGTLFDAQRFNLWLRTGHRVLYAVAEFPAATPDDLYAGVRALPWEEWLLEKEPFTVSGAVQNPTIRDPRFAWLRTKDAIADRLRETLGARPDSTAEAAGSAGVFVRWKEGRAAVYIDTSGEPLAHRGYRLARTDAPMQETLAAAVILATGWRDAGPLLNPMCGSGTLAIEAAWIGLHRAPGLLRRDFAFMHLRGYDAERWTRLCEAARREERPALDRRIVAGDVDPAAIEAARANARAAGVESCMDFETADFESGTVSPDPGVVVMNPEYGARMGEPERLAPLYRRIGRFLTNRCPNWRAYVLTGNAWLARQIGVRPDRTHLFFNGPIECRLLEYGVREGSRQAIEPHRSEEPPREEQPPSDAGPGPEAGRGRPERDRPRRDDRPRRERPWDVRGRPGDGRERGPQGDRERRPGRGPPRREGDRPGFGTRGAGDRPGYGRPGYGGQGSGRGGQRADGPRTGDRPWERRPPRPGDRYGGGRYGGDRPWDRSAPRPDGGYGRDRPGDQRPPLPDDFGNRREDPAAGPGRRRFDRGSSGGNRFGDRRPYPGRQGEAGGSRGSRDGNVRDSRGPDGPRRDRPSEPSGGWRDRRPEPGHRPWEGDRRSDGFRGGPGGERSGPRGSGMGGPDRRDDRRGGYRPSGPRRNPPGGGGGRKGGPHR